MSEISQPDFECKIFKCIAAATELKEKGNVYFKDKNYKKAIRQYHNGLMYTKVFDSFLTSRHPFLGTDVNITEEIQSQSNAIRSQLLNNLAACLLKEDPVRYERVLDCCLQVTECEPANLKALYRTALSYYQLKDYKKAEEIVKQANDSADGKDAAVKNLHKQIRAKLKGEDKESMKLYEKLKNTYK